MKEEFYLSQWNNVLSTSPKRQNLDDRIHRMLSDSPTQTVNTNAQQLYQPDAYTYPMQHDNQNGVFYQDMYHANHQMPPPSIHLHQSQSFSSQSMNHHGQYDEFNSFSSPRNFVNNSNLVEITQQKRDRQRAGSSQAVQVGNVLEIVPNNKIVTSPEMSRESTEKVNPLSPEQMRQQAEKRVQAKLKRKIDRERKRVAKHSRKEMLRQKIQRYFDCGVTAENSDDEFLIPLRDVNITAVPERSIIRKTTKEQKSDKRVLFSDGILPGETTSEEDDVEENENSSKVKHRRKKFRKKRLLQLIKNQTANGVIDLAEISNDPELDKAPPPLPPIGSPPFHTKQPKLKKVTSEMFAAFPVNPDPIYYYIQKLQQVNGFQTDVPPPRMNDRFHYYKKQPPPNVGQSPSYLLQQQQQQRSAISKQPNSGRLKRK